MNQKECIKQLLEYLVGYIIIVIIVKLGFIIFSKLFK